MRTSRILSITLPPQMLKEAEELASKESRTMSELFREALRYYQRARRWDEINAYGRARARQLGIRERDVVPIVKEFRRQRRKVTSR